MQFIKYVTYYVKHTLKLYSSELEIELEIELHSHDYVRQLKVMLLSRFQSNYSDWRKNEPIVIKLGKMEVQDYYTDWKLVPNS